MPCSGIARGRRKAAVKEVMSLCVCFHQAQPARSSFSSFSATHVYGRSFFWKAFSCSTWSETSLPSLNFQSFQGQGKVRPGPKVQSFRERCMEGLGALLLESKKWDCFMRRRWKCGKRHYLPFVFSGFLTNIIKCSCHGLFSTYTASMIYKYCISGGLLFPKPCRHWAHHCPQPIHLPPTQPWPHEKNKSPPFLTSVFSQVPEMGYPTTPHPFFSYLKPTQCSGLPASTSSRVWRGKRVEHHLGKHLEESLGNLVSCPSLEEARKLQRCDVWQLQIACTEAMWSAWLQ